jgi:hypothetical protein
MKIFKNYKLILSAIVFFLSSASVYSYPPDNAAIFYYKTAILYAPDEKIEKMLEDFSKETADFSKANVDKIREFVNENRSIIDTVLDAAEIKNCDWGVNYSQGPATKIPQVCARKLAYLVLADAKILAKDGNYETALSRCMSLYKIARHINDRIIVTHLLGIAVNGKTNFCVMQIMSDMPQDIQILSRLKNQLAEIDSIPFSVKPGLLGDRDAVLMFMTPERISDGVTFLRQEDIPLSAEHKAVYEKILSFDAAAIERSRKYFENFYASVIAAFDMPYQQGYTVIDDLIHKTSTESDTNPDAILTAIFRPALGKIFSLVTRSQTHDNAIKAAMELYMMKAKTGKLPDKLPADLPGDLFSGKPFNYEKTPYGFILRCQGKERDTDKVYQYEFKVK